MNALGGLKGSLKFDTIEYTYDSANQIISAGDTVFRHDLKGNMIEKIEPGDGITEAQAEAQAETDNGGSEGKGSNAGSSGGGADSGRASTRYCYNRADRLWKITLPDGTPIKNYYDYDGLRIKKIDVDGKTVKYYWDNNAVIPVVLSERDNSNPLSSYIYDGFSPLFFKTMEPGNPSFATAKNNYYLNDHLSSILALSNENAIITNQYEYDEYGIPIINTGRSSNTNGYTGQDYDDRTELLYLRARYYSVLGGVFNRIDPLYMDNRLSYMPFGNPINFYDPLGYASIPGTIAGLLAIFAGCEPLADLYSKMDKAREIAENEWWNMTENFESSSYNPKCDKSEQAKEKFVKERIKNSIGLSDLVKLDLLEAQITCGIGVVFGILLILKT